MSEKEIGAEIREKAGALTWALYRVTAQFSKDEPLRFKLRQTADEILSSAVEFGNSEDKKKGENL